jgi:preprotein translocase subunit SecB
MNILCPGTLFPYARRAISDLVADGGFPPLTLQPVNFEQLYAQRMQGLMKQQGEAAAGGQESGATVKAEFPGNN